MKLPERFLRSHEADVSEKIETLERLVDVWLSEHTSNFQQSENRQATDIVFDIEAGLNDDLENKDLLWEFTWRSAQKATTTAQLALLAAGPLEVFIANAGDDYIDEIEALARQSLRFRYVLTGVWPQGQRGSEVWQRIEAIRASMMPVGIDSAAEPPDADLPRR